MDLYRALFNNVLTKIDAERVHHMAMMMLRFSGEVPPVRGALSAFAHAHTEGMAIEAFGLHFDHPLGLAAGLDKNATCVPALQSIGFSFAEIGSVTPQPQPGNEGKRIFRLVQDSALINRMGFPSEGVDVVAQRLAKLPPLHMHKGISLGKNKLTPLTDAHEDYCAVLKPLQPYADFFVINVSSPNTAGLKNLQTGEFLSHLLAKIRECNCEAAQGQSPKPMLIKISPDLATDQLDYLLDLALTHGLDGIIATNTHPNCRDALHSRYKNETGGLSGAPIRKQSTDMIRYIYRHTQGKLKIIGVGGIFSGEDIWEKMAAGATLVQSYTGFIYEGPLFVKKALGALRHKMQQEGVVTLSEIIGTAQ